MHIAIQLLAVVGSGVLPDLGTVGSGSWLALGSSAALAIGLLLLLIGHRRRHRAVPRSHRRTFRPTASPRYRRTPTTGPAETSQLPAG